MRPFLLALLASGLLSGCKHPSSEPVVTTAGDTVTVTYPSAPAAPRILRRVVEYGEVDGSDTTMFADLSAFSVESDGGLIVAEAGGRLRRFRADGSFDRMIASKGAGPGEVLYVRGLARLPAGGLVARDQGNARLNYYRADLTFDHQWLLPPMSGYGQHALTVLTDGQLVIPLSPPMPEDGSDMVWPRPAYLHMEAENQPGDTIFIPARYVERCPVRSNVKFRAGWYEDFRYYYVSKVQWALLPSGALVVGCPAAPLVDVIEPDGHVTRIVFPWRGEKVSRGELAQAEWNIAENQKRTLRGVRPERADLPSTRSAFVAILAAEDGRIWVWRAPARVKEPASPEAPPGTPPEWWLQGKGGIFDVFQSDGTFLGSVEQPKEVAYQGHPGTLPPVIRGDSLWAVIEDEDEVQTIAKFVVTPGLSRP